jgi:murein DD-endopeptidase MepM/ murein hydrolase activator NlpD
VKRLVVFALGGVFGAVSLYLLAPRVRALVERYEAPAVAAVATDEQVAMPAPPVPSAVASSDTPARAATPVGTEVANAPAATPTAPIDAADAGSVEPKEEPDASWAEAAADLAIVPTSEPAPAEAAMPSDAASAAAVSTAEATVTAPEVTVPAAEATVATPAPAGESTPSDPPTPEAAAKTVVGAPPDIPASLLIPVKDVKAESLIDTFTEARGGGTRPHDAIDIMAPAGTPVVAVDDGRIAKLFLSQGGGGITVYQFDPTETFAYYYAHLERYADGLAEGQHVKKGDVIGYVGATGNANPAAPHLHFAIMVLGPDKRWWEGTAINPYPILIGATKDTKAEVATNQ